MKNSSVRLCLLALVTSLSATGGCKCGGDTDAPAVPEAAEGSESGAEAPAAVTDGSGAEACGGQHPDAVALVNCEPVMSAEALAAEVADMVSRYERLPGREPTNAQWRNERRRRIVRAAVQEELLKGWVAARGVVVTDEEVSAHLRTKLEHVFDNEQLFARFLESQGKTREAYIEDVRSEIAIDRALAEQGQLEPTDEDIAAFYEQNRERWREGERVLARSITIRLRDAATPEETEAARQRINDIRTRVTRGGEDFATVAEAESESADRVRGGDRGWIVRGRSAGLGEAAEGTLFAARPGSVTEPLRTELGYQIFLVVDKRAEGFRQLDEVADVLREPLRRRNRDRLSRDVENNLVRDAEVIYVERNWGLEDEGPAAAAAGEGAQTPPVVLPPPSGDAAAADGTIPAPGGAAPAEAVVPTPGGAAPAEVVVPTPGGATPGPAGP